jgi:uncharacterized protein with NRDE domain
MCTIAIVLDLLPGAPLVIAANRDELYARPARPPELLERAPLRVAGGVDEVSGGTWLDVRADARFAAVTNQRALATPPPGLRSRGLVVREVVTAENPDAYVAALDPARYASMNLVWGGARGVRVAYTRREDRTLEIESLGPGIHVLCNDRLGADGFPRGARLHAAIRAAIEERVGWPALASRLERALADHVHGPIDATPPSHLPPAIAHELTATCIHTELYGTRSSTIIAAEPGRVLAYRHADGPPCVTPFADLTPLLEGTP